jgi:hypothetical protein
MVRKALKVEMLLLSPYPIRAFAKLEKLGAIPHFPVSGRIPGLEPRFTVKDKSSI